MALVKCPDCGKMVSSRVAACPFCGCPADYFDAVDDVKEQECYASTEQVESEKSSNDYETEFVKEDKDKDDRNIQTETIPEKEPQQQKFDNCIIFNFNGIAYAEEKSIARQAKKLGDFMARARKAAREVDKLYTDAKGIDEVMEKFLDLADEHVFSAVDEAVKFLYSYNIYTDSQKFFSKYEAEYSLDILNDEVNSLYTQYKNILGAAVQLEEYRASQKENRMHFYGGGFGIGGALKGVAKAGALNAASSILHAPIDASRSASDKNKMKTALDNLYKDSSTKTKLVNATFNAVKNVYLAMSSEIYNYYPDLGRIFVPDRAAEIYYATKRNEKDPGKILSAAVDALMLDPTEPAYLTEVYKAMLEGDNNFEDWISFWGLDSYCGDFKKQKDAIRNFNDYLQNHGMYEFNFANQSISNAMDLREVLYEYKKETGLGMPDFSRNAQLIKAYLKRVTSEDWVVGMMDLFAWIPEELSLDEYMDIIKDDVYYYNLDFLEKVLDYKGKDKGQKVKKKLLEDGSDMILYDNTSFTGMGNKGFALTTKYAWDLKSEIKIQINGNIHVKVVDGNKGKALSISDSDQEILWEDNSSSKFDGIEDRYWYMRNLILDIVVFHLPQENNIIENDDKDRSGNSEVSVKEETKIISEGMISCKACGKLIKKDAKFCNFCGARVEDMKSPGISAAGRKFCPKCGKQLNGGAKFCNFCGTKLQPEDKMDTGVENNISTKSEIPDQGDSIDLDQYIINNFDKANEVKAIKYYREKTGLGLKEAKDKIDSLFND